jgi:putative flippase GtrA
MGFRVFLKAQSASILGSGADYLITIFLTEFLHLQYIESSLAGNISGGTMQFILCRNWAFRGNRDKATLQMIRFVMVFAGNLILSAAGLYALTVFFKINYLIAKTIVSVVLGTTYNYLLQKNFVFV